MSPLSVLKRLGQAVLVLFGVFTGSFVLLYLLPADALVIRVYANSGGDVTLSDEQLAQARAELGLDASPLRQYLDLLGDALRGDFGRSIQTGQHVSEMVAAALPHTLQVGALALLLGAIGGLLLGFLGAWFGPGRVRDTVLALPPLGVAVPSFVIGLVLIQWIAFDLALLPSGGNEGFTAIILPALTLAIPAAAVIAQVFSKSLIATLGQPYIETALAKGVGKRQLYLGHAFRNAISPTLAVGGIVIGNILAGSAVTETVFYRNGLGRLTVDAVNAQDSGVVLAVALLSAVVFVTVNLAVDLLLPVIDRRVGRQR